MNDLAKNISRCVSAVETLQLVDKRTSNDSNVVNGNEQYATGVKAVVQELSGIRIDIRNGLYKLEHSLSAKIDSVFADWMVDQSEKLDAQFTGQSTNIKSDETSSVAQLKSQSDSNQLQ